ncbi:MAG: hypothetical protein AB8B97_04115 [Granulosicoccus sp.]
MSITDPDNLSEENVVAYAAVTLCGNTSRGAAPQWEELSAWSLGTLDSNRSAEVLSHVANDPICFQQWLDIAEAQSWVEEEARMNSESETTGTTSTLDTSGPLSESAHPQNQSRGASRSNSPISNALAVLKGFFQLPLPSPGGSGVAVYGGAFAAVCLAVLIVPLMRTGETLSVQQQLDRSTDAYIVAGNSFTGAPPIVRRTRSLTGLFDDLSISDVEQRHLQSGQKVVFDKLQSAQRTEQPLADAWQEWLAELPAGKVDCDEAIDSAHCTRVANDFQLLGQWSLLNATACDTLVESGGQNLPTDFWQEQYIIYNTIRSSQSLSQSTRFAAIMPPVQHPTPRTLCSIANSVMAASQ